MTVMLAIRNASGRRAPCRRATLERIAEKVCEIEKVRGAVEASLLFCTDPFIQELNKTYRKKNKPTDVLSFAQDNPTNKGPRVLGDIVISLETVERHCAETGDSSRSEVELLFCHGLLHLLGHDHASDEAKALMAARQAECLGIPLEAAWPAAKTRRKRPS